jgi:hypothetical protein
MTVPPSIDLAPTPTVGRCRARRLASGRPSYPADRTAASRRCY